MCDMKTMSFSDASSSRSDCGSAIAEAGMDPWGIRVLFGPVIGPVNPGRFRHALPEKRRIVRPTREKYGKMSGFGLFDVGLISVRSAVRVYPGPF
jgi:hypothetical protein